MIYIVLNSCVLINLLFIANKFKNFQALLKNLLEKENAKIFIPTITVDKEIIYKNQRDILQNMIRENIIELVKVKKEEIENIRLSYSRRLGLGEKAMFILVKRSLENNKLSIGFTNDKLAMKKMESDIPLLHGLWFYTQMFTYGIIDNKKELEKIINEANKDMKMKINDLEDIKKEYINKKASLEEIITNFKKVHENKTI
jgi:hypothetical protein